MIRKLSLAFAVVGVFGLLMLNELQEPKFLSNIENLQNNEKVLVLGKLTSVEVLTGGRQALTLETRKGVVRAVCKCKHLSQFNGKMVELIGRVRKYNGRTEILVLSLRALPS
ncbi:hypothetical protein D6817_00695 [Candidatus Pacearchaeota archaeon]|nr:MAG: hypothetical protein D6817_00695 [Candidatus Pacearchaeota archaeon]